MQGLLCRRPECNLKPSHTINFLICLSLHVFVHFIYSFVCFSNRVVVVLFIYFYFRRFVYMFTLLYICLFVYFSFPVNFRSSTCLFIFLLSIISVWLFFNLLLFLFIPIFFINRVYSILSSSGYYFTY